jgi:hypothetical protein
MLRKAKMGFDTHANPPGVIGAELIERFSGLVTLLSMFCVRTDCQVEIGHANLGQFLLLRWLISKTPSHHETQLGHVRADGTKCSSVAGKIGLE